ncbi:aldose epimerase family protein [Streptococcus dentiloxodontae]
MEYFGDYQGRPVYKFTLENAQGTQVSVLTIGGLIHQYSVLQGDDRINTVVSLPSVDDYYRNPFQINKQIGRVAGRIKDANFSMGDKKISLQPNDHGNILHGGDKGLAYQHFEGKQITSASLQLHTVMKEQEDGFPGDLDLKITYDLQQDNRLNITYQATALNKDTVFDPTVHIYWQLSDQLSHTKLWIDSAERAEVTDQLVPTGQFQKCEGSGYDFKKERNLAEALAALGHGIDDAYHLTAKTESPCAIIRDGLRHLKISVYSQRNALVVFTADPLSKGNLSAVATEPQTLPDAVHHPSFGDIVIKKGQTKTIQLAFKAETI